MITSLIYGIGQSAAAAYAHDTPSGAPSRQSVLSRIQSASAASSSRNREPAVKDKWVNYSTASQLGFDDPETSKSSYEIEQELGGRAGEAGAWETIEEPHSSSVQQLGWVDVEGGGKRKLGEYLLEEEEDNVENFKFQHRDKRPVNDLWDDEDWDPRRALGDLEVIVKEERRFGEARSTGKDPVGSGKSAARRMNGVGLKREDWSGKLELELQSGGNKGKETGNDRVTDGLVFMPNGGGWVIAEPEVAGIGNSDGVEMATHETIGNGRMDGESKKIKQESFDLDEPRGIGSLPEDMPSLDIKPDVETSASSSLFKKRRPLAAARKK